MGGEPHRSSHGREGHVPRMAIETIDLVASRSRPLFPEWANSILWLALALIAFLGIAFLCFQMMEVRTPYFTGQGDPHMQPVKFDHRHHVRDDGIPCLYCHYSAERSSFAGIPSTSICMNCHNQVWTRSPELAPVRESYFSGKPIVWTKVNHLPGFVYFNHSIHIAKGVGCVTCHGRIDLMGQVYQAAPLLMSWCLGCHRQPEEHLRPRDKVTDMTWKPDRPQLEVGRELVQEYDVHPGTDCWTCHR